MALNWQTFKTRTITSIVFAAVMLAGLLWNRWSFFVLFSVIHFGCWFEYQKLVRLIDKNYGQITPVHRYSVMLIGWCIMLYFIGDAYTIPGVRLHEIGMWGGLTFLLILLGNELLAAKNFRAKNIGHSLFGLVYISLSWGLLINLYREIDVPVQDTIYVLTRHFIPVAIIASIWINDTMAYLVGSLIGRHPVSKISPKKTWEGTIGGIILSVAIVGLSSYYGFHFGGLTYQLIAIAAISAIAGTFGDFFQSKLKRLAAVKDSGNFMPGFGGFLDRFDSTLFAIPAVWLYVFFFMR